MDIVRFWDCNVRMGKANHPHNSKIYTAGQIQSMMDDYEIEKAVIFHKEALTNPVFGNQILLNEVKRNDRLIGCAVLAPNDTGEFGDTGQYFQVLRDNGFEAIRLFPKVHFYPLKDFCLDDILRQAGRFRMPVFIDEIDLQVPHLPVSTWLHSPSYADIYELAMTHRDVNFVVIMPGMLTNRTMCAMMAKCANVYFECATFGYKHIEFFCERFSAQRLIYGSYAPVLEPGAFISYIMYADISGKEKEMIAARNLEALLGGGY